MNTINDLSKKQYNYRTENEPFHFDFIRNPYTFIKGQKFQDLYTILKNTQN